METVNIEERLSNIAPSERVLLLSHCQRPSQTCPGKFNKKGLVCPEDCTENCAISRFKRVALRAGYKGVCIAAGGAMAIRFVEEYNPAGIVAVACDKELAEGIDGVREMAKDEQDVPVIATIPLLTNGCVDTTVDEEQVMKTIVLGCSEEILVDSQY